MQGRGKIVHWGKAAAAKPENLSWSHMVSERSCPLTSTVADAHTHTIVKSLQFPYYNNANHHNINKSKAFKELLQWHAKVCIWKFEVQILTWMLNNDVVFGKILNRLDPRTPVKIRPRKTSWQMKYPKGWRTGFWPPLITSTDHPCSVAIHTAVYSGSVVRHPCLFISSLYTERKESDCLVGAILRI